MTKERVHLMLRPKYNEKLLRLSKEEGVAKGVIVERGLDKIKEKKGE